MEVSKIYNETLAALKNGARRVINQGGQYSGKTVNILGVLATLSAKEKGNDAGVTTITSGSFPHLKGGALRDFEMFVYPSFENAIKKYHKTDHIFTFKSGSLIEFKVFETEMDARGPKRKRLFVNEANKFEWLKFFHLDARSDQTLIDYNPSIRFWAHEKYIGHPGVITIISDHRHNPFLTEDKHRETEKICTFARNPDGSVIIAPNGEPVVLRGDYELWKVYARGLTGNVRGVIFPDWQMIEDWQFPPDDGTEVFCIDFGYTNDPTAVMKIKLVAGTLFVKELGYETGMPAQTIRQLLISNGYTEDHLCYCEHDPDMIRQLRNLGIYNALPARKGQGSVNAGIKLLQEYKVFYTSSSKNVHRERGKYIWITDDKTGKLTNVPIDQDNHTFDAIRYGAYSRYLKVAA